MIIVVTIISGFVLTKTTGKAILSIGGGGTIAVVFGFGYATVFGSGFDTGPAIEALVGSTLFGLDVAKRSSCTGWTETAHVAVNLVLAPDVVQGSFLSRTQQPNDADTVVVAIQSTVWYGPRLELAMKAFPAVLTQARIGVLVTE